MSNAFCKITLLLFCSLTPVLQACKHNAGGENVTQQMALQKKRDQDGMLLSTMLNDKDFERALKYIDSLHIKYPNDPQFYFVEGWVYAMQNDSVRARDRYSKSMEIYDSLIAVKPDSAT